MKNVFFAQICSFRILGQISVFPYYGGRPEIDSDSHSCLLQTLIHDDFWVQLETVIRLRHDNIVVNFQKFAIISHNSVEKSAFNNFDSSF